MTYMRQLVVLGDERAGLCVAEEGRLSSSEVEAVVGRLSKVRVQAARFRSRCINIMSISPSFFPSVSHRYSTLPQYLEEYLTRYINPFV